MKNIHSQVIYIWIKLALVLYQHIKTLKTTSRNNFSISPENHATGDANVCLIIDAHLCVGFIRLGSGQAQGRPTSNRWQAAEFRREKPGFGLALSKSEKT